MTGDTQNVWPLSKFYFSVTGMPGHPVFQAVDGLETEPSTVAYRAGNSSTFAPINRPGLAIGGSVTLKKGIFISDQSLWSWINTITMNTIIRGTIVVTLSDETGAAKMRWTLTNAFPVKLTGTDLKSDGNEVAVESVEIAFESMTAEAG